MSRLIEKLKEMNARFEEGWKNMEPLERLSAMIATSIVLYYLMQG